MKRCTVDGPNAPADVVKSAAKKRDWQNIDSSFLPSVFTLGTIEIVMILGLVDVLFLSFVGFQVPYLFGGMDFVQNTPDFKLAEYARRGFGELVAVSALVLPMLLLSHWLLRRETKRLENIFRILAGIQIALVFVIMASAVQRLVTHGSDEKRVNDIVDEDVVITISHEGYIKRTALTEYRRQGRGGKGSMGSQSRDKDFIEHMLVASNHNYMLFFTETGRCFWLRVFEIPEGTRTSKGRAIQNVINIPKEENIKAYIKVVNLKDQEYLENNFIIMCTKKGTIKKTSLEAYSRPRSNGINAININEGDQLLEACMTNGSSEIVMALRSGRAIRFNESTVRPMGRTATGVRGVTLASEKDEVVGMISVNNPEVTVLVVSENGYGKRTDIDDYRVTNRGGKGVKTLNITEKTGELVAIKDVTDTDDLMIINKSGIVIRIGVADLRVMGRATQGVRLITFKGSDSIASVAKVPHEDDEEEEGTEGIEGATESTGTDETGDNTSASEGTETEQQ